MALERRELRDEVVAVIAAGRELSPEHDYMLAELFLETAQRRLALPAPPVEPEKRELLPDLVGPICVALAALLLGALVMFHAGGDRDGWHSPPFGSQIYDRGDGDGGGGDYLWWQSPRYVPNAPASSSSPASTARHF